MARPRLILATPVIGDDGQEYPYLNVAFHSVQNEDEIDSFTSNTGGISTINFQATFVLELTYYRLETEQYFEVTFDPYNEYSESHQVRKLCIQNGEVVRRLFTFPKTYRMGPTGTQQVVDRLTIFGDVLNKAQDANRDVFYPTYADSNLFELPYSGGTVLPELALLLAAEGGQDFAGLTVGEAS